MHIPDNCKGWVTGPRPQDSVDAFFEAIYSCESPFHKLTRLLARSHGAGDPAPWEHLGSTACLSPVSGEL